LDVSLLEIKWHSYLVVHIRFTAAAVRIALTSSYLLSTVSSGLVLFLISLHTAIRG